MVTDPQSLFALARCYECFAPNVYTADLMQLSLLQNWVGKASPPWSLFTSALFGSDNTVHTIPHFLPGTPNLVYASFVNQVAEAAYSVGDELGAYHISWQAFPFPSVEIVANATNIIFQWYTGNQNNVPAKTTAAYGPLTVLNWNIRIYAAFFGQGTLQPTTFTTQQIFPLGPGLLNIPHPFGKTPQFLIPYIDCVANDAATGYLAGDTFPLWGPQWTGGRISALTGANSSNIFVNGGQFFPGNEAAFAFYTRGINATVANPTSLANFALRVVAMAF